MNEEIVYNFLELAEQYVQEQNDENWFYNSYHMFKLDYDPKQALRKTLILLYGEDVSNSLESKSERRN